jgi:tRNA A58 N-methylase Trm61
MKQRYLILPMGFVEDGCLYKSDLRIVPLSIESYLQTKISFTDDDGMIQEEEGVRIHTKSGMDFDILLTIEDFELLTEHY